VGWNLNPGGTRAMVFLLGLSTTPAADNELIIRLQGEKKKMKKPWS
jgi:hypothetical protein